MSEAYGTARLVRFGKLNRRSFALKGDGVQDEATCACLNVDAVGPDVSLV